MSHVDLSQVKRTVCVLLAGVLSVCALAGADDAPKKVKPLALKDTKGKAIAVPHADQATVLLFLRPGQEQSLQTLKNVKAALEGPPAAQVLVVLSGKPAAEDVAKLAADVPWPIVMDPDYELVGQLAVRVWPLTAVVLADGTDLARLAGMPQSYVQDLAAYLEFAGKKIDRATLDKRLASARVVGDTPRQMADRHLRVAERLLAKDMTEEARQEVERGLKLQPTDARLLLAKARILLQTGQPGAAMNILTRLDEKSALAGKIGVLKGWAMVNMGRWDDAIKALAGAVKLNPDPSEGHYFLGVAYQNKGQADRAAAAFRAAFEATPSGRPIAVDAAGKTKEPAPPAKPATKPAAPPATKPAKALKGKT